MASASQKMKEKTKEWTPLKAELDEDRCCAFTKSHVQCKLRKDKSGNFCFMHPNYFTDWFDQNPPLRGIRTVCERIRSMHKEVITNGYVEITQDLLCSLKSEPYAYVDYYVLCCQNPRVDPMWVPEMLHHAIAMMFRDVYITRSTVAVAMKEWLLPLIRNPHMESREKQQQLLEILVHWSGRYLHTYRSLTEDHIIQFWSIYVHEADLGWCYPEMENRMRLAEKVLLKQEGVDIDAEVYRVTIRIALEEIARPYELLKYYQKMRMSEIKEELIAVAWGPDRMMEWCMDIVEMQEMKMNWE